MAWTYFATLAVITVCGLALIWFLYAGARQSERDQAERLMRPPERTIPGFQPEAVIPQYLSELDSRDEPAHAVSTELTDAEHAQLQGRIDAATAFTAGYALGEFVTDRTSGWAVLRQPAVVVLTEGAESVRELLPVWEATASRPLVVVARSLHGDVVDTLRANKQQRVRQVVAIVADEQTCALVAAATGATPIPRRDLQSGWVPAASLGGCAVWVSSASQSWALDQLSGVE